VRLHDRGREWRLGRPEFAAFAEPGGADAEAAGAADAARAADADGAATDAVAAPPQIVFAVDGIGRAAWTLSDQAKPTAAVAVAELRAQGLAVELVTGDRSGPARAFAASVGIDRLSVRSECTPADKADRVRHHQDEGRPVLFVGDGFNDGSALAVAEVGVACGGASATDLARAAGRVVLQRGDPRDAARAVALGRATLRVIRQNLALSLIYNVVALPWAMGLLARFGATAPAPAHAGLAMAASSLAVVLNALRLARSQRR
jgi:P-type E1-E2 ATPase